MSTTATPRTETAAVALDHGSSDTVADARELAEVIHRSADVLLERLLSHLSLLPEVSTTITEGIYLEEESGDGNTLGNDKTFSDDNNKDEESLMLKRGVTLPVSAVAWLSDQLDGLERLQQSGLSLDGEAEDNEKDQTGKKHCVHDLEPWLGTEAATSLRYRLNLLRFLLPRAQMIRMNRQSWPPKSSSEDGASFLCKVSSPKEQLKQWWRKRQRQRRDDNDSEDARTEIMASNFLRYARRFEHGASKCVNLSRVFPNATVLILESVPTSWIDTKGGGVDPTASPQTQKQPALRLISVTNAAIYDLEDFLPPSTAISTLPSALQSPLSSSITHLKLDHCSLGELTTGFASSLARLVHLEYLSLSHNQFRSAKTLLRGLRPLTRLRYLDVSANQLMGCFGPFANLCLGGQVRTLKLSENMLTTCKNSGLEKCYALREIWLDSNQIEDVVEVSGLARLPDLQCLALQRNPFSTRTTRTPRAKWNSSPPLPSITINREDTEFFNNAIGGKDNPFYDPDWKIRLWTWFQHERRAVTPLELPVLNKKTKNMGSHHNGYHAATIGRMTREEWDRIQEESYSVATTATVTTATTISSLNTKIGRPGALSTKEGLPKTKDSLQTTAPTPTTCASSHEELPLTPTDTLALRSPLVTPVRNLRVTKKSRTRQAKIHTMNNNSKSINNAASVNRIRIHETDRERRRRQRKSNKTSSKLLVGEEHSGALHKDENGYGKQSKINPSMTGGDDHTVNSNISSGPLIQVRSSRDETTSIHQLSFSLQDVLVSIHHEHIQERQPENTECETQAHSLDDVEKIVTGDNQKKESLASKEALNKISADNDAPNNPFLEDNVSQEEVAPKEDDKIQNYEDDTNKLEAEGDNTANESCISDPTLLQTQQGTSDNTHISKEEKKKCDESDDIQQSRATDEASNPESAISSSPSSTKPSLRKSSQRPPRRNNEDRIFVRPKLATIKLSRMGNYKPFDALNSDWEDVIKKASEGRIPDGLLKSPVGRSQNDADVFSDEAAILLADTTNNPSQPLETKVLDQASGSRSTSDPTLDPSLSSNNRLANALPQHVWQDDNSVLSSLGASRDDMLPRGANKFQLAEENCIYDGPDSSRGMKVVENIQLYFETFVFHSSMPDIPLDVLEEMEEDQDDWQLITMHYPRIQLWPDDRRFLELERARISPSINNVDWIENRERFLRVWEEDIVPCGKPTLRRLPPNRRNRLGFHGDKLFENADVDAYAECRKVLLCLSSKAFYVIVEKDDVTTNHQQQAKKEKIPTAIGSRGSIQRCSMATCCSPS